MCLLATQTGMFCRLATYPVATAGTRQARGLRQTMTTVYGCLCDQPTATTATAFTYDRLGLMYNGDAMVASAQFAPLLWSNTTTLTGSSEVTVTVLPTGGSAVRAACLCCGSCSSSLHGYLCCWQLARPQCAPASICSAQPTAAAPAPVAATAAKAAFQAHLWLSDIICLTDGHHAGRHQRRAYHRQHCQRCQCQHPATATAATPGAR